MFNHILKDIGERGTVLSFDLGERPYLFDAGERGQVLCTGPEWRLQDGPGWQMYGPPDGWEKILQFGPIETGSALLH
ncbi:hypothetical protein [Brevibacillus brevis]|uniref:hypothetical protein n=1 Tax=Brevibacillus brevis TaxID=1393 RepID=UPI0037C661EF